MTFIDTQSRPMYFKTRYDQGSNDYIVTNNYTQDTTRHDTLEDANDYIASELLILNSRPAKLSIPTYGFGNTAFQSYGQSRKRTAEANTINAKLPRTRSRLYKSP